MICPTCHQEIEESPCFDLRETVIIRGEKYVVKDVPALRDADDCRAENEMTDRYYLLKYECSNCLHGYLVQIPYKQEALQYLECPNCGLNTVSKTKKDIEWFCVYELKNERLEPIKREN